MSVMQINGVRLPDDRPLTVDDLDQLPDDGNRYELADGVLEVTSAPFGPHERVVHRLEWLLEYHAPAGFEIPGQQGIEIELPELSRYRIPDLAVTRSRDFEEKSLTRPPLLVVEVASAGTKRRDRITKKKEYEAFGVQSYWIIVPDFDAPSITAFELIDGAYTEVAHVSDEEVFRTEHPFPFAVTPRQLTVATDWKPRLRID
ncbi:MAG TPA: Uma2 family endonuclease [Streptosporangiaceae bacterium]